MEILDVWFIRTINWKQLSHLRRFIILNDINRTQRKLSIDVELCDPIHRKYRALYAKLIVIISIHQNWINSIKTWQKNVQKSVQTHIINRSSVRIGSENWFGRFIWCVLHLWNTAICYCQTTRPVWVNSLLSLLLLHLWISMTHNAHTFNFISVCHSINFEVVNFLFPFQFIALRAIRTANIHWCSRSRAHYLSFTLNRSLSGRSANTLPTIF